jgi:hypothetical protein
MRQVRARGGTVVACCQPDGRLVARGRPVTFIGLLQQRVGEHRHFIIVLFDGQIILHTPGEHRGLPTRNVERPVPVQDFAETFNLGELIEDVVSHDIEAVMVNERKIGELRVPAINLREGRF